MKILSYSKLNWAIQPLSRFLLLFFLGLLYAFYFGPPTDLVLASILILLISFISFYFKKTLSRLSYWLLSLIIFLSGCFHGNIYSLDPPHLTNVQLYSKQVYFVKVTSEPLTRDSTISFEGDFFLVKSDANEIDLKSPIRVKATLVSHSSIQFLIGQTLVVHGRLFIPNSPIIPGVFDYSGFLKRKKIDALMHLKSHDYLDLNMVHFSFLQLFINWRNQLVNELRENGLDADQLSIASALLLGARSEISEELNDAYSESGITHILAVSGMHVGLVFIALGFFLKRLKNKLYVFLISLLFLWSYACLTGLSPSVVRAAWMFSFIACGKLFRSGHQKWNSIAASALLMLLIDPFIWLDVGFQLSFMAVWGIVSLGKLPEKFTTKFKWVNHTLEAAWISCAAQLCTLPVSLYIFGKFPIYFLLANIFAIPLSTCLTYWGIFCFIVLPIAPLARYSCKILGLGIDLMNFIATSISEMPSSTFDGIHLSIVQSFWIATIIYILAAKFISSKQKIKFALVFTLIMSAVNWISFSINIKTSRFFYYSNSTAGMIESKSGTATNYTFFGDGANNDKTMKSLEAFFMKSSIDLKFHPAKHNNFSLKSFLLTSNIDRLRKVLFVSPEVQSLNPYHPGSLESSYDCIILFSGGSFRFKRLWRLAALRKKIPLIELSRSKTGFQMIISDS